MSTTYRYPDGNQNQSPSYVPPFSDPSDRWQFQKNSDPGRPHHGTFDIGRDPQHDIGRQNWQGEVRLPQPHSTLGAYELPPIVPPRRLEINDPGAVPVSRAYILTQQEPPYRPSAVPEHSSYMERRYQRYQRASDRDDISNLRLPEPVYDPRRQTSHRRTDFEQDEAFSLLQQSYRERPPLPSSHLRPIIHRHYTQQRRSPITSLSRRYGPYPPPGQNRRRPSSNRRRYDSRERGASDCYRPQWSRTSPTLHSRQQFRERSVPSASA